jgi:hypothetical protein
MSLEDLGNIGEFVAAVGVVISLVYLAIQIRQNTRQMRKNTVAVGNASYHQALEQGWMVNIKIAEDPELARIMRTGFRNSAELNDDERMRCLALMQNATFAFENLMRLREHALIDADAWENLLDTNERYFRHPGVQHYLSNREGVLSRRFRELLRQRYGIFEDEVGVRDQAGADPHISG